MVHLSAGTPADVGEGRRGSGDELRTPLCSTAKRNSAKVLMWREEGEGGRGRKAEDEGEGRNKRAANEA